SKYHGDLMASRAGLDAGKVRVVHNGVNLRGFEPADSAPDPPVLGYLARMCPAKGLDTLVDAFIKLRSRNHIPNLKLRVAGSQNAADRKFVDGLMRDLLAEGLASEAMFFANVDRAGKIEFLRSLSVMSVPATYGESF